LCFFMIFFYFADFWRLSKLDKIYFDQILDKIYFDQISFKIFSFERTRLKLNSKRNFWVILIQKCYYNIQIRCFVINRNWPFVQHLLQEIMNYTSHNSWLQRLSSNFSLFKHENYGCIFCIVHTLATKSTFMYFYEYLLL
jgi:hypothetical protein